MKEASRILFLASFLRMILFLGAAEVGAAEVGPPRLGGSLRIRRLRPIIGA